MQIFIVIDIGQLVTLSSHPYMQYTSADQSVIQMRFLYMSEGEHCITTSLTVRREREATYINGGVQ